MTVDSGAGKSVIGEADVANLGIEKGKRTGCKYEVASGDIIYNKGKKKCAIVTQETTNPRQMTLQVSDVHKRLLSVVELNKKGQRVVFDSNWSYIQDKSTGSCDSLVQTDDAFELVTLVKPINQVKSEDFDRRGR